MRKRLLKIADYYGLSVRKFEADCGLLRGNISNMSEKGAIGSDKLTKITDSFPDVNLNWVLSGKGEMLKLNPETPNTYDVKEQKPPPVSTPEPEMATVYSMMLERIENMARENALLNAENKQLKVENEELKKYKLQPHRNDFDSVPSNPLIIVDKLASEEYELETQ